MGFFDFLFGEGPSTETTVLDTLTPEQQQALNQLLRDLGGASPTFGGETSVDASELQTLSLEALEQRAIALGDPNRESALAQGAADTLLKFLDFESQDAGIDDFFNTNIRDPALEDFQENVLPRISRDFGGANFFSSERRTADRESQEELISSLTQARSGLAFNARESDRNRALQAAGLIPALDALERGDTSELLALLQAGESATGLTERNLARDFDRFLAEQGIASDRRAQLLGGINTQSFENVVTQNPGSSGLIPSLLGGGGIGEILNIFKKPPVDTKIGKPQPAKPQPGVGGI